VAKTKQNSAKAKAQKPWLQLDTLDDPLPQMAPTAAVEPHGPVRLLDRVEVEAITSTSYVTIWHWMNAGVFPRSRIVGGKSKWLSTEVDEWLRNLPIRKLKCDKTAALGGGGKVS